jgi:putative cell wall-binding protein
VVAFSSNATNLVNEATFGKFQVFSRDVRAGATSLVSVDTRVSGTGGDNDAQYPAISGDGRVVSFSTASVLTLVATGGRFQVYARDILTGTTEMVSVDPSGSQGGSGNSYESSLSGDGRLVAFGSDSGNLRPFGQDGVTQIHVRDRNARATSLVSVDVANEARANEASDSPAISADGRSVTFQSNATNLVPETGGLTPGSSVRVFSRKLDMNRTVQACRAADPTTACDSSSYSSALSGDGSMITFSSTATNIAPDVETSTAQIYVRNMTEVPRVDRIGGADRFAVSAGVATDAFGSGVPVAYVASGAGFADALSGSAAAGAERGPMLLVTKDTIPTVVGIELHRLKPQRIVVLGGTNSVDTSVEAALAAYAPTVSRISGADRFEVSAEVSKAVFGRPGTVGGEHPPVYVASGAVFPDALSGSAAAGTVGGPVLLVTKDGVPASVLAELKRLAPSKVIVLGGRNTIADSVVITLGAVAPTSRVDGADRFAVSAAVSASSFPGKSHTVYVASGAVFPDALSGSAAAIQNSGPVLLVTANAIPAAVVTELDRLDPTRIVVLGGPNTVSEAVFTSFENYLEPA